VTVAAIIIPSVKALLTRTSSSELIDYLLSSDYISAGTKVINVNIIIIIIKQELN
jgi:hypothetical protein